MFNLENRTIILTGAAGHLGTAMSGAILAAGAELVATGRREDSLEQLRDSFDGETRARCYTVVADVTREEGIESLRQAVVARFPRVHGLVNNAYAGTAGAVDMIGPDDFATACRYNLTAPFALTMTLLPFLERGARESDFTTCIVNVASMYGTVSPDPELYGDSGRNNPVHYGATKAGMIQMTRYLACHFAPRGVRVNSISPGPFPNTAIDPGIPDFFENLARKVPMKRVGHPEEVAGPTVFLLSAAASFVTGVNLPVDGGWTAW